METLVIGIDGAEWNVITPLIKDGELPNLAALNCEGISGELTSSTPPVSAPAWNSILTGTNPGKHGIFDFVRFDEEYQHVLNDASDRTATPFWTVLEDHDVSTGLFKVPFTYPPDEVSGFMVAGFPTPGSVSNYTYPRAISKQVGPLDELFENGALVQESRLKEFRSDLDQVAQHQTDGFIDLLHDYETEFGMIVYDGVDRAQHNFWKHFDEDHPRHEPNSPLVGELRAHYKAVDKQIGRILKEIDDDCDIIVISDHGFEALTDNIYIDEWLEREGLLKWKKSKSTQIKDLFGRVLQFGWELAGDMNIKTEIKSILSPRTFKAIRDIQENKNVKWDETVAFLGTASSQAVFVNLEDRFGEGIVAQSDYDEFVSTIQNSLRSLVHPDSGEPIIESVLLGNEVFEGGQLNEGPDLIIIPKSGYSLKGGKSNSLIKPSNEGAADRSGDHKSEGIIIASGPSFDTGSIKAANIVDIAPTLLYLHQAPIPTAMDGEVIKGLFNQAALSRLEKQMTSRYTGKIREGHKMSEAERSEVESRLNDIGYL